MGSMGFSPGDLVHVAALGKGTVREVRNGERYLVEIKGRSVEVKGDQLTPQTAPRKVSRPAAPHPSHEPPRPHPVSLDLHGKTVMEALDAVSEFLNGALLAGSSEVRIIHGRSGGKIKSALHQQLKGMRSVRRYRVDAMNAGVTVVEL